MRRLLASCPIRFLGAGLLLTLAWLPGRAELRLPSIIGDNMVLQRDAYVWLWGWDNPGQEITVRLPEQEARGAAREGDGKWYVRLSPLPTGGPISLTITGSTSQTLQNVLVGEVWVASGQSNMQWSVANSADAKLSIEGADRPWIRLFTVPRKTFWEPQEDVEARWEVCSPETVPQFSAVAYFFGRELYDELKVPIGLIHTSWGGTPAEAWTRHTTLEAHPDLASLAERRRKAQELAASGTAQDEYKARFAAWKEEVARIWSARPPETSGWEKPGSSDADWREIEMPGLIENTFGEMEGIVWLRRQVEIPKAWRKRDLVLHLGPIDDFDAVFFNGEPIGGTGLDDANAWKTPREYRVPASAVRPGAANLIAIRLLEVAHRGGLTGPPGALRIGPAGAARGDFVPLAGLWRARVEGKVPTRPPEPNLRLQNVAGVLNDSMIAPIVPFAIQGVIWYQGESNVGRAKQYKTLFPAMIRDWRAQWGQGDFSFYFVQLANFNPRQAPPGSADWAELREAQAHALTEPNTGMAVAIDIGDPDDIHPRNKQEVGRRLALIARALLYGKPQLEYSGPVFERMKVEDNRLILWFTHAKGLTTMNSQPVKGFEIAGPDGKYVPAQAEIVAGKHIALTAPEVPNPVAVRYAWANSPEVNLVNLDGLPVVPFRANLQNDEPQPEPPPAKP